MNILWFFLGGFIIAAVYALYGLLFTITIIGIPFGKQCFKLARLSLAPFGKEIVYPKFGAGSVLMNILWILLAGIETCALNFAIGVALCCTIIGIPFGIQFFKLAALSLLPFGADID
ncbi:MAG: YccF domain-containing protein [Clostridiales bacterium]|jgi:uncharacterized membrane protein YccF (DUF307 family)|nr:YccF domain-containing protein [Clostridiales bacterium]HOA33878.1 YccF domain-containing protein [Clostridiales bacterium]HOL79006.1 YccF domain-containing protein [Clostridiales bacterium]HPP68118.1 YccF domain-containing protein [Clostridiales bacterium]HPU67480.1 YccF domain-containing protein [Clostridiales bacterium]